MARGRARIGCSGWSYDDWRGRVYPTDVAARDWFGLYSQRFDTVEINNTFYRLPQATTVEGWARQAPADFVYALKLGQYASHRKKLKDPDQWLGNHLDRVRRFGASLGPTLVQLPPRWKRNVARLDEFFDVAPDDLRWAVELRDPSWLHDDVFDVLQRHRVALCVHDLLPHHVFVRTTDWTYLRFHGPDALRHPYRGAYGAARLEPVAAVLDQWLDEGCDVYGYFNNDYDACAVADATWLRDRLGVSVAAA